MQIEVFISETDDAGFAKTECGDYLVCELEKVSTKVAASADCRPRHGRGTLGVFRIAEPDPLRGRAKCFLPSGLQAELDPRGVIGPPGISLSRLRRLSPPVQAVQNIHDLAFSRG